ncbi:MAG: carbohydrate binding family 9 domain-containing protein [Gemmatimonadaceae bacterium]|nr:carbohydrate binding family 9 domain-containing protein [Chitinophagaceae bacterium]
MNRKTNILLLIACLVMTTLSSFAQNMKQLQAKRTTGNIKIDGNINDAAWKDAAIATDFIEYRPSFGQKENFETRTTIYLLYDNMAIYVAGYCRERTPDSVSKELIGRDKIGANDFVGIIFDTYLDKINAMGFYVTPLGEQYDARYYPSENGEDDSWNAVWDSESELQKDGWTFEIRIPYSALRFNSKDIQNWGLNITRRRQKTQQQYMWNEVDPKKNGFINQFGEWTGIEKIKSPVRLSFTPYFSTYASHYPSKIPGQKDLTGNINGGMDVKYGINQSFTLDMTLIPDFGQVQSDNQVLNLSPFEVKFNENRAFFTEGTELFSKGNLFYSRRIGGQPLHFGDANSQLHQNETISKNPGETKLLNATKVSGRTKGKLGIGIFNAVTKPMYATIEDDNKTSRKYQTSPLTNYNILVLDQSLKNNSSISLINTNVLRSGADYDANVTAAILNLNNKKNTYNLFTKFANSNLINKNNKTISGYSHTLGVSKTAGRFNFTLNQELVDNKYDHNDMGILFNNNYIDHYYWMAYRWLKPTSWYNRIQINYNLTYSRRFKPADYQSLNTNVNANIQMKNLMWAGFWVEYRPDQNDFYEPRKAGSVFKRQSSNAFNVWMESNFANRYSWNWNVQVRIQNGYGGSVVSNYSIFHKYRFSDKLSIAHEFSTEAADDNIGFAAYADSLGNTIFGKRNRLTIENILTTKYNFTNKMGINLRVRHYSSKVEYSRYYRLLTNGTLDGNHVFAGNADRNVNWFNVDLVYSWQFAPGSFINIVWKNITYAEDADVRRDYFKNVSHTLNTAQNNNLSLKVIYFLDYLQLRRKG